MTVILVEIAPPRFDVDLDLRYATADNITGRPLYRSTLCLLHPDAAAALDRAVTLARAQGFRLRLFDGYRPPEAQERLWEAFPDPDFIADPRQGSNHSRGTALDLTLARTDGTPLDMGTGFDDMTPLSHHGNTAIAAAAQRNRGLLLGIMVIAGWEHYAWEWWHYQLPEAGCYPLLSDSAAGCRLLE